MGDLRSLAESELANGIGISTVAFTADGLLVVVPQAGRNIASAARIAPSGRGSLDLRDLPVGNLTLDPLTSSHPRPDR